jgi:hypothetical protein
VKHFATSKFRDAHETLPVAVSEQADKAFELLKQKPSHPSLHFKKVGRFWLARVNLNCRALAIMDGDDFVWLWIGNHKDSDRLLKASQIAPTPRPAQSLCIHPQNSPTALVGATIRVLG